MTEQKRNQNNWVLLHLHSITRCRLPKTGGNIGQCDFLQPRQNLKLLTFGCFLLTTPPHLSCIWDLRNTTVTTMEFNFQRQEAEQQKKEKKKKQTTDHLALSFYIRLDSPKENCQSINLLLCNFLLDSSTCFQLEKVIQKKS